MDTSVVAAVAEGTREPIADGRTLLEVALDRAGCWEHVDDLVAHSGKDVADVRVFILPDMELYDVGGATGTDPALVEHLIDLLCTRLWARSPAGLSCSTTATPTRPTCASSSPT